MMLKQRTRMHEDPVNCLRDRVIAMEHNLDTLRTRLTQVADMVNFRTGDLVRIR